MSGINNYAYYKGLCVKRMGGQHSILTHTPHYCNDQLYYIFCVICAIKSPSLCVCTLLP